MATATKKVHTASRVHDNAGSARFEPQAAEERQSRAV
jgi:hypothetical protein